MISFDEHKENMTLRRRLLKELKRREWELLCKLETSVLSEDEMVQCQKSLNQLREDIYELESKL